MSELVKKFSEAYKGVPQKKLEDVYFVMLNDIGVCYSNKNIQKLLELCQSSLALVEPLIKWTKKEMGSFLITSIPAIEYGCRLWAVMGVGGQLDNIKEMVEYFPELKPWRKDVEKAYIMKELASKIYKYLKVNNSCLQKDLKKILEYNDGRLIASTVHYMTVVGKIEKKDRGNTNLLTIKQ